MSSKLIVHSLFYTIQGEGVWAGRPAVFVRLQGCNLRCPWCDEPNALEFNKLTAGERPLAKEMTSKEVFDSIRDDAVRCGMVVFTGGEPTAQNFSELFVLLKGAGVELITVETNGTLYSTWLHGLVELGLWITLSPKPKERAPNPEVVKLAQEFKLIIESPADAELSPRPYLKFRDLEGEPRIYLQAEDSKRAEVMPAMIEAVKKLPYRLAISSRLHKYWNVP